jgi:peptidyl-prolyl cis-trans isomerase A (cyclophilin A)
VCFHAPGRRHRRSGTSAPGGDSKGWRCPCGRWEDAHSRARDASADRFGEATADDGIYAVFETTLGDFVCRLEPDKAPITVGNFVGLAEGSRAFEDPETGRLVRRHFYDGLLFHRIVRGFVIQGGDPKGDGSGGPGYSICDEIDSSLVFDTPGVLAMASDANHPNGSQFFITLVPAPHLNGRHNIFGHVVSGMDVVRAIAAQPLQSDSTRPRTDILMRKVRIVRTGPVAQDFDADAAFAGNPVMCQRLAVARREATESFLAQLATDEARAVRTPTGLLVVVLQEGSGDRPQDGDLVSFHCTGYLAEDGTRFWSTYDRGQPFRVKLGSHRVMPAWEEAAQRMRPGEKCRLIVPPELGYGESGNRLTGIPGGATLVFDMELLGVERR